MKPMHVVLAVFLLSAGFAPVALAVSAPARDLHTYARPEIARVTDVALELTVDFERKQLAGTATLILELAPGAGEIVLDTRKLTVTSVHASGGQPLSFSLGAEDATLGQPLIVPLPQGERKIVIAYHTAPDADALQWLTPEQTAGKVHPYLFSQGEPILTRTWIPTQDSPGIRQTYSARITVPEKLRAVMSAEMLTPDGTPAGGGRRVFEFRMTHPIPPYLIALAVGDIAFRPLGERTGVYAEPSVLDRAAYEFAETEKLIAAAESLSGPYRWGRYDLLVLPPSFPYGGQENPGLTFVTPTILAGDRSLVSLIAHELAHSWSGNLVTNATWSDFWLNEGFTTYFENRIMEKVYGADYAAMLRALQAAELRKTIANIGSSSSDTMLHLALEGRNPDEAMTDIPYLKGAAFLRTIEKTVGRDPWDAYLRSYFDRHAFQSQTTSGFLDDLRENLIAGDADLEIRIRPNEWAYGTDLPDNAPREHAARFDQVEAAARAFLAGGPATALPTAQWSTHEWLHFIGQLPGSLPLPRMAELDRAFRLSEASNNEILFSWLRLSISRHYESALPALERFLKSQGRRKYVRPLYQELMLTDWGAPLARRIYAEARAGYHSIATSTLDKIVK